MPRKRTTRTTGFRATRNAPNTQYGGDFLGIGNWVKGAANYVKDRHILSSVAGLIPHPAGSIASFGLRQAGLGKRRKTTRTRGALRF